LSHTESGFNGDSFALIRTVKWVSAIHHGFCRKASTRRRSSNDRIAENEKSRLVEIDVTGTSPTFSSFDLWKAEIIACFETNIADNNASLDREREGHVVPQRDHLWALPI